MNSNYYDLFYTVNKNRDEKQVVKDDDYEIDYINFNDFKTPKLYFEGKNEIFSYRKMRSQINQSKHILP